jgi:hypothetical protein
LESQFLQGFSTFSFFKICTEICSVCSDFRKSK